MQSWRVWKRRRLAWPGVVLLAAGGLSAGAVQAWHATQTSGTPAAAGSTMTTDGRTIYHDHCASCHGTSGRGDGPAAAFLNPHPRDFTTGNYEIRSTESGSVPTEDDLITSVTHGLPGSSMPAWKGLLTDAQIRAVVDYVKTLSSRFADTQPPVVNIGKAVPTSPESVARGAAVYKKLQCTACHGTDGRGTGAIARDLKDDTGHPLNSTDLTEPWTFEGGATARDVYLRFRTGMTGTPMPSYVNTATDAEMWDLANYVLSFARKPAWQMSADELHALYAREDADAKKHPVERGRYLVDTLACSQCHSPIDREGHVLRGLQNAGGQRWHLGPWGDFVTMNLTSDRETGLGSWTDDQIKNVLTRGTRPDGSRMLPFPMGWTGYADLTPQDLNAIVAYLRTIPPVHNAIPAHDRPNIVTYLWGKFRVLIMKEDPALYAYPGNAGSARGGAEVQ
ncbi:MAG TPA: c-type cytochrome [Vicinamibacterales bacterium]